MTIIRKILLAWPLLIQLAGAEPFVVDDHSIRTAFRKGLDALHGEKAYPSGDELAKAIKDCPRRSASLLKTVTPPADPSRSVFLIGSIYKCGKCDKWHLGGIATAWCLSSDGLMATNHHVFARAKGAIMGICDREGNTWPVTGLVSADPGSDLTVFRVKGSGFTPLPLGKPAAIGDKVRVISHPNGRYYLQTFGEVSRYHKRGHRKHKSTWMSITADFAKGSSGGPVLSEEGKVIGMVASTSSIYYESDNGEPKGPLQMVVKNCVPISAFHRMLKRGDN